MLPGLKQLYKQKGTLGVLEWLYDKNRFLPIKILLKTCFLIFPFEYILRTTANYDQNIRTKGFAKATKHYLQDLNINIQTITPNTTNTPILIFANHPTGLDPYLIVSALDRNDVYVVADIYQKNKGHNIGNHVIPIIYTQSRKNIANRGILNAIGFIVMRIFTGYEAEDKVKQHNRKAIEKAAQLLTEGNVVIIFPDGGSNNTAYWYTGIGEIIKYLSNKNIEVKLLAAQINNISTLKLIHHFLFNQKKTLATNPVQITLSAPFNLDSLNIDKDTHDITDQLRHKFTSNTFWDEREHHYG
jgi:1-acyl-sn-glycerol-3-phosphate acyltransferase